MFGLPAPDICSQATQFYFLICEMHQMLVFVSFSRFIAPPSHQIESQNLDQRVWKTIFFKEMVQWAYVSVFLAGAVVWGEEQGAGR